MLAPLTATQTLDRARQVMASGHGAGLPELLQLIETLSTNLGEVTVSEIAELIEKDAAVLARLLTVANTVYHNPNIKPLSSVHHAIHQVGFQRIRSLAVSLMLLENTGGAGNPPEQREAAAQALCAGLLAQGTAQFCGTLDPETAFACAALRQFGHILLPAVSLEHYRAARERLKTMPADLAWRGVFGLTPLDLSRRLLAASRLPDEVMHSLRDCEPAAIARLPLSTDNRLLAVADLGGRLATLTLDATCGPDVFAEQSRKLARPYEHLLPDPHGSLAAALVHTDERITSFARGNGGSSLPTPSLARIKSRVLAEKPDGMTDALLAAAAVPTAPMPMDAPAAPASSEEPTKPALVEATEPEPSPPPEELWTDSLSRSAAFSTQSTPPVTPLDPWLAVLTLVRDRLGAHEVWLFQPAPASDNLALTHGVGDRWQKFQSVATLRRAERTVFGVCLTRQETVVIHNTDDPSLRPYLPDWLRHPVAPPPRSFLLVPAGADDTAPGIALIGWRHAQQIVFTPAQAQLVRQLFRSVAPRPATAA
jgi:HD-like signal output (HDOD) protein